MQIGEVYMFVLLMVLTVIIVGVGILVLQQLGSSSGVTGIAKAAIDNGTKALAPITATWMPLWVTIGSIAVVLTLVLGAFLIGRGRLAR